jgi:hypothetical protein
MRNSYHNSAPDFAALIPGYACFAEGVEFIETVPIAESDRRKISFGNAKALYKM